MCVCAHLSGERLLLSCFAVPCCDVLSRRLIDEWMEHVMSSGQGQEFLSLRGDGGGRAWCETEGRDENL